MSIEKGDPSHISAEMREFLKQQEVEAEIQAVIDAAREIGLEGYTREDAIKGLLQEPEEGSNNE